MTNKADRADVLVYRKGRKSHGTVERRFIEWRSQQDPPIPMRCDEPACVFHRSPLIWNGKPFKPTLDHKNGVNGDDRPENLRFLCPICDRQLPTHGGGNKGRAQQSDGGFALRQKDGHTDYTLPVETGKYTIK